MSRGRERGPAARAPGPVVPDGVVLVDKPAGITSYDVIRRLGALAAGRKIGHTGTLDPFATGLLPLCLGEATKLAPFLSGADKEYVARVRLGARTDTGDRDGRVVEEGVVPDIGDMGAVRRALGGLTGPQEQVPPMYSAVRVGGERLYDKARRGETVDRAPREVTVHALDLLEAVPPEVVVRVVCSKGTYVRVLAEAIASALGTVGHLARLRRTRLGPSRIEHAAPIERILDDRGGTAHIPWWIPLDGLLAEIPSVDLDPDAGRRVVRGQVPPLLETSFSAATGNGGVGPIRVLSGGRLLAIAGRPGPGGRVRLLRVLNRPEPDPGPFVPPGLVPQRSDLA